MDLVLAILSPFGLYGLLAAGIAMGGYVTVSCTECLLHLARASALGSTETATVNTGASGLPRAGSSGSGSAGRCRG